MRSFLFLLFIFSVEASIAQISGVIRDKATGKEISGAEVFINNSRWRSITDKTGVFSLAGLEPGFVDLVVYKKDYDLFKSSIRIQKNKEYKLNLDILHETTPTKSAKVKMDNEWNNNLQWFTRGLLGSGEFANSCKIENLKSLQFQREGQSLMVSCYEPIKIQNASLGFQMNVFLLQFKAQAEIATFQVLVNYVVESSSDYKKQSEWERNRLKAYWGSSRHLFQSLVAGTSTTDGFLLSNKQNQLLKPEELVSEGRIEGYYKISIEDELHVTFQMESTNNGVKSSELPSQSSVLIARDNMSVTAKGLLFNSQSVEIKGRMVAEKLAYSLPIDYEPTASLENEKVDWKNFSLLREKVYLHTDRDYYYPRETIWLKAYLGYSMPALRDTLSQTLYVELLSPEKSRLDSKVYSIKEGIAWGEFKLENKLPAGQYYLRAYTNWMRNYGDSSLFVKSISILKLDENVDRDQIFQNKEHKNVSINLNKDSFKAREKINLTLQVKDDLGKPIKSRLSISVTDAIAAVPVSDLTIENPASLKVEAFDAPHKYFDQVSYYMERGISFRGVVKDAKNIPTPATLQIIQGNMDNLIEMETDEQGGFLVTGVKFTDSLIFAFKPFNKKGKPLNRVELIAREIPPANFNLAIPSLKLRKDNAMQRIQNTYQPDQNVTLLKEVQIKSSKLASDVPRQDVRIYGNADYVVKGENIRATVVGTNFLVGLQGKVPGLSVIESVDGGGLPVIRVRVRGGTSSVSGATDPLILVDGVPFPDAQSISALDVNQVDRVEVITRAAPQFGSRGTNGVIAIYTKSGFAAAGSEKDYLAYKVAGYSKPQAFFSPTYDGDSTNSQSLDFRTTIFWRPDITTDDQGRASVQFYSADLATKYRIVAEGVTESGEPVRVVKYITIE